MESFDKLVIGSAHEGAEGMFQKIEGNEQDVDIAEKRKERLIFEDINQQFEQLLAEKGLEQVREIAPGLTYPTPEEWINHRIRFARGTRFFPCFVKDEEGKVSFLKVQIRDSSDKGQWLAFEGRILQEDALKGIAPRVLDFSDGSDGKLGFVRIEAIPFSEGSVARGVEWSAEHAVDAAQKVRRLEEIDTRALKVGMLAEDGSMPQSVWQENFMRDVDANARAVDLATRAKEFISSELREQITQIAAEQKVPAVFVHGDATLKNLIITREQKAILVDWELAGKGFLGQDAGKLLDGLRENPVAKEAFLNTYLAGESGGTDLRRRHALYLGMVVESLVHLVWRVENMPANQEAAQKMREDITQRAEVMRSIVAEYLRGR